MEMDRVRRTALRLVFAAVICDYIGVGMMRVTMPFFAKDLGGSGRLVGGLETTYGVGQVCGALVLPKLSDTWGRRGILLLSFAGSAVGYATCFAARSLDSPALLLLSRMPVGLAKQTVTVSRAVVADCTPGGAAERSCWMSRLAAVIGVGYCAGPFLGGQLAERVDHSAPAVLATAIFVVLMPVVALLLPETSSKATAAPSVAGSAAAGGQALWRSGPVLRAIAVLSVAELGLVAHTSVTLSTYAMHTLGKGSAWLGNVIAATALLQAVLASTLLPLLSAKGCGDRALLRLGAASFAAASALIATWPSPEAVWLSVAPVALACAVLRSYPASLLSKLAPQDRQGEAITYIYIYIYIYTYHIHIK